MRTLLASTLALLTSAACSTDTPDMMEMPDMEETPGAIGVVPAQIVRVIRNASVEVPVTITRDGNATSVTVSLADLPAGVTAEPIVLEHGATTGVMIVTAGADIALGSIVTATLRASAADGSEAMAPLDLRLTDRQGALDVSFNDVGTRLDSFTGADEWATDVVRQPDGKWLVAGVSSTNVYYVARLNADGTRDMTFANAGVYKPPVYGGVATSPKLVLRADGTILLGTRISGFTAIRALDSSGKPLVGYGNRTAATELSVVTIGSAFSFADMVAGPNGSVYVAGIESGVLKVVRLNAAGLPDPTFDTDGLALVDAEGNEVTMAVAVRPDGRPIVAGRTDFGGDKIVLAQLTLDGQLDPAFSGDGQLVVDGSGLDLDDVIVLSTGKLALATSINSYDTLITVNLDGIGTQSESFADSSVVLHGLTEHDNAIYSAGFVTTDMSAVMKFTLDGKLDTSFATGGLATADTMIGMEGGYAISFDDDGRAFMVGLGRPEGGIGKTMLSRVWL